MEEVALQNGYVLLKINIMGKINIYHRKEIKIRYVFNEESKIMFVDPCCDGMPLDLWNKIISQIVKIQDEYNANIPPRIIPEINTKIDHPFKDKWED